MGKAAKVVPPKQGGGLTVYVLVAAFVAAQAGLIFGYDLVSPYGSCWRHGYPEAPHTDSSQPVPMQGVTGGVTSFPEFEAKFFPSVIGQQGGAQGVTYCQYDNQALQLFTSSLYLAGIFSTLVGGYTSRCAQTCNCDCNPPTDRCNVYARLMHRYLGIAQ